MGKNTVIRAILALGRSRRYMRYLEGDMSSHCGRFFAHQWGNILTKPVYE